MQQKLQWIRKKYVDVDDADDDENDDDDYEKIKKNRTNERTKEQTIAHSISISLRRRWRV